VRQQYIAFYLFTVVDHDVHDISGTHLNLAIRTAELFNGDEAFGLVSDVDDDFGCGNFQDTAF
jgi:hypothetical protein